MIGYERSNIVMKNYHKRIINTLIVITIIFATKFIQAYIKLETSQREIKIQNQIKEEKQHAYELLKENSPYFNDSINRIAKLQKVNPNIIRNELIAQVKKEEEINFKKEKSEILDQLSNSYRSNKMSDFEKLKNENLEKYFENDISTFQKQVEEYIGFKIFTYKELDYPKTQILKNDLFVSDQDGCIYVASYSAPLYLILNYVGTEQVLTAFVRQNEYIKIPLQPGEYKMHFMQGYHWFGEEHKFYPIDYDGSSSKNLVMDLNAILYFDDALSVGGIRFCKTDSNNFFASYRRIQEQIQKESDPNNNLYIHQKEPDWEKINFNNTRVKMGDKWITIKNNNFNK